MATDSFWTQENVAGLTGYQSFGFRAKTARRSNTVTNVIKHAMSKRDLSYQQALEGKKLWQDEYQTKVERTIAVYEQLAKGNVADQDLMSDETYKQVSESLQYQTQLKYLQLYYDSYMADQNSDLQWRLGNAKATVDDPRVTDEITGGGLIEGQFYTRSDMNVQFDWQCLDATGSIARTQKSYAAMSFPPYKLGSKVGISEKTSFGDSDDEDRTYDRDSFLVKRENFAYRDVGMKQLSDYINFLQWVVEGCTGIVSTYLTEWDLSIYIQEGMMTPKVNGGPMNIYLNYRIYEDNPLADSTNQEFVDDTALAYNVCGSAVSKLFYDCAKQWRPSDYAYSVWWTPYVEGTDFYLKSVDLTKKLGQKVPYMSFYDEISSTYSYDSHDAKDIIKRQDYIGFIAAAKNRLDLHYYDAFYTTVEDGLSDIDIKMSNMLKAVAGADYGKSTSYGRDLDYLVFEGRKQMLLNGGYYGGQQGVSSNGGFFGRDAIEYALAENDVSEKTASQMAASYSSADAEEEVTITSKSKSAEKFFDTKKDSSQMADLTGINRWSPAIFGGPHGSSYSLNHLRSYYDAKSILARNLPRAEGFTFADASGLSSQKKLGNEVAYANEDTSGIDVSRSPIEALAQIKEGTYQCETQLAYVRELKPVWQEWLTSRPSINGFWSGPTYEGTVAVRLTNIAALQKIVLNTLAGKLVKIQNGRFYFRSTRQLSYVWTNVPKFVKHFFLEDRPDLQWSIVAHKFTSYSDSESKVSALASLKSQSQRSSDVASLKGLNSAYVLCLPSINEEKSFIRQVIRYNRGLTDLPRYMYFVGSSSPATIDSKGPEYIFKAPCYVRWYENFTQVYAKSFWGFGKKRKVGVQKTYMPFIYVDLRNVQESYFGLQDALESNKVSGKVMPTHIDHDFSEPAKPASVFPIQEATKSFSHKMTAYMNSVTENQGLFDSISTIFSGPHANGKYQNFGRGKVVWTDTAHWGIQGKGIVSGWPGIAPSYKNEQFVGSGYMPGLHQAEYLRRSDRPDVKDLPLSRVPLSGVRKANDISPLVTISNIDWKLRASVESQTFRRVEFSSGLQKAINKINQTLLFYSAGKSTPCRIDFSVPYRNFLSWCLTERNYMRSALEILQTVSFDSLRKLLMYNVDACVLKACGLRRNDDDTFTLVRADTKHVLYDYWIDYAIQIFYDKSKHTSTRSAVIASMERQISSLTNAINNVQNILRKDSSLWSYNEIKALDNEIAVQKAATGSKDVDKFLFAYLHILYYYRLYFIGHRFNKKDGTMWVMRALESTIDLISNNIVPAKQPDMLDDEVQNYAVAFYEVQNSLDAKREVVIDREHAPLEVDRVKTIYVQVQYGKKSDYEAWLAYKNDPNANPKVPEVLRFVINENEVRYAIKPEDGLYTFRSKEFDKNYKNDIWNAYHKDKPAKTVVDYIDCTFDIQWVPTPEKTPIRFNVLGTIDPNNLLIYSQDSISAEDLICLTEVGSDFWTINIPMSLWPDKTLYKTGLYISKVEKAGSISDSTVISALGPFANTLSPVVRYESDSSSGLLQDLKTQLGVS